MAEKIILMSDIHITEPGVDIAGLNPAVRFKRCLEHAAMHHADANHLFLMGDLTDRGQYSEYKILENILDDQPFPVTLMLGNHDQRSAFSAVFSNLQSGFQQGIKNFQDTKVFYLDTLNENAQNIHGGLLCTERLHWLDVNLCSGTGPIIILSHHHMLDTGFDALDAINLQNSREVAEMIAASGRCQMVITGHIHRILISTFKGTTHATIKSPCHQMEMVLGSKDLYPEIADPGGYGVLLLHKQTPILHHVDVDL